MKRRTVSAAVMLCLLFSMTLGAGTAVSQTVINDNIGDAGHSLNDIVNVFLWEDGSYLYMGVLGVTVFNFGQYRAWFEIEIQNMTGVISVSDVDGSGAKVIACSQPTCSVFQNAVNSFVVAIPFWYLPGSNNVSFRITAYCEYPNPLIPDTVPNSGWGTYPLTTVSNQPPVIDFLMASPSILWAPNHKPKSVKLIVDAEDPDDDPLIHLYSVEDEYHEYDVIEEELPPGGIISLVTSKRGNDRNGRVYTITVTVSDPEGLTDSRTVKVIVPHDKRKKR